MLLFKFLCLLVCRSFHNFLSDWAKLYFGTVFNRQNMSYSNDLNHESIARFYRCSTFVFECQRMIDLHLILIYIHINWPLARENNTDNLIFVAVVFVSVIKCRVSSLFACIALMFPHSHQFLYIFIALIQSSLFSLRSNTLFLYIVITAKHKEEKTHRNQSLNKYWQQWHQH